VERRNILLLAATGAIAVGLFHPDAVLFAAIILELDYSNSEAWFLTTVFAFLLVLPVLPFVLAATHVLGGIRLHWRLAWILYPLIVLPGALLTLVIGALSGSPSLFLPWAHGMTLTLGLASSVFLVSSAGSEDARLCLGWVPLGLAGLAGLWSLLVAALVVLSSSLIADGKPFCVALDERTGERTSVAHMRGFPLYAASGYDRGIVHSFHAVLVLPGDNDYSHNWSFAKYRFVPTDHLTADMARCTPKPRFWSTVPLFSFSLPPDFPSNN
jgi:hypothetical protein